MLANINANNPTSMLIFKSLLINEKFFFSKSVFNMRSTGIDTRITPPIIGMRKRSGFIILVNKGKIKKIIAAIAATRAHIVAFSTPILIANVLTPNSLSPSMSSQPLMISRESKRNEAVK